MMHQTPSRPEAEILFPVICPVCAQEALTGFRMTVVTEAFRTGAIRLYSNCHLVGWDATKRELHRMHEYLEASLSAAISEACADLELEAR
jgi:hypothetical protein